jgi:hypothetical protein
MRLGSVVIFSAFARLALAQSGESVLEMNPDSEAPPEIMINGVSYPAPPIPLLSPQEKKWYAEFWDGGTVWGVWWVDGFRKELSELISKARKQGVILPKAELIGTGVLVGGAWAREKATVDDIIKWGKALQSSLDTDDIQNALQAAQATIRNEVCSRFAGLPQCNTHERSTASR